MSASKVWLISGANSGLGLALAKYVHEQGHKVIATARSLSKLPAELNNGKTTKGLELDLDWPDARIQDAGRAAWRLFGHIDVVANNAGYSLTGPVETLKADDVLAQFRGNVFGHLSLIQGLLPLLRERNSGTIFNLSSIAGVAGNPPFGAYNASKAALEALTEALAKEVAPFGIRAYIVEPGYFPTNFLSTAVATEDLTEEQRTLYPQYAGIAKTYASRATTIGDPRKLAARLIEIVETPLRDEWVRIPLGGDCGKRFLAKLELVRENVEGTRALWESTNVRP
ncbi:NAD(P)-binding protein [Auricularia subglabra TFB-10046 SS5]|uniref:NAD(P)-binding protein n=1 Tax=Auricularia subglabra (strain TFB-10046 / SS5) TaxID=717982 RepID=J0D8S4_AURST|nr:NAD(P)-binding protein [Auricularia subglabra TFB-10046 SS5]